MTIYLLPGPASTMRRNRSTKSEELISTRLSVRSAVWATTSRLDGITATACPLLSPSGEPTAAKTERCWKLPPHVAVGVAEHRRAGGARLVLAKAQRRVGDRLCLPQRFRQASGAGRLTRFSAGRGPYLGTACLGH